MKPMSWLVLFLGTWTAAGQGVVDFRNGGMLFERDADRKVYFQAVGGIPLTGTNYVAGLWFVPGADRGHDIASASQAGQVFHFRPHTTASPGTWAVSLGASPSFTLNGVTLGQTATLQVRVWDGEKYPSFAEALAAGEMGMSVPFNYTVPVGGSNPFGYQMGNLRAFAFIPEPSTWAFVALAAFGLWWRGRIGKRRKELA